VPKEKLGAIILVLDELARPGDLARPVLTAERICGYCFMLRGEAELVRARAKERRVRVALDDL
jgi:hypothetical protein